MISICRLLVLLVAFLLMTAVGFALAQDDLLDTVDARFAIDNAEPLIGEPFELTLIVTHPQTIEVVEWPLIEDMWTPYLQVFEQSPLDIATTPDGNLRETQALTLAAWRVGAVDTPETYVAFRRIGDETIYRVPINGVSFRVPTVLDTTDLNQLVIRSNKPAFGFFYVSPWAVLIGVLLSSGIAWLGGRWALHEWKRRQLAQAQTEAPTPLQAAIHQLNDAESTTQPAPEQAARISTVVRLYLEARFAIPAKEMTASELIQAVTALNLLSTSSVRDLMRILELADTLKFTGVVPEDRSLMPALSASALTWLYAADEVGL